MSAIGARKMRGFGIKNGERFRLPLEPAQPNGYLGRVEGKRHPVFLVPLYPMRIDRVS